MDNVKTILDYSFTAGKLGWKFIDSIGTSRYSLNSATGDLGDNSDDAGATKFWIGFMGPSTGVKKIIFADNGSGMDYKTLEGSFTLGYERKRTTKQLGKFGVGGTLGCLNMASEKLTITRDKSGKILARKYDLQQVKKKDCWGTTPLTVTEEMEFLFNSYMGEKGTGTVITLSRFDRRSFSLLKSNLVKRLTNYCSSIYCEKIASGDLKIFIDNQEVESKDPLYWYHPDVIKVIDEVIPGTNCRLRMVNLKNVKLARGALIDSQGGYFFRCNRLIKGRVNNDDNWSKTWTKDPNHRWVRWGVYFDGDEDINMGVTYDKSDINPCQSMADKIQQLVNPHAKIIEAETSKKKSNHSKEDKKRELGEMSDVLETLSEKDSLQKSKAPNLSLDKQDNIVVDPLPDNVIEHPDNFVNIPTYMIKDVSLGQLAEPFMMRKNDDPSESQWVLEVNLDHRYIVKYYLNSFKEVRNAVISWMLPFAFSILASPDAYECDLLEFREMFNRKLIQATTKVDRL